MGLTITGKYIDLVVTRLVQNITPGNAAYWFDIMCEFNSKMQQG